MSTTAAVDKAPTKEQLDRIRELAQIVLGDPDALFAAAGYPENTWQASAYLGALHKFRNKMKPLPGTERDIHNRIADLRGQSRTAAVASPPQAATGADAIDKEEPPMADTKTCRRCGQNKPADEDHFGSDKRAHDGLGATCSECKSSQASRARKATGQKSKTASPRPKGDDPGETSQPPSRPDPPLSDGWAVLSDPRLSDLRRLQELLEKHVTDSVALEDAAGLATAIAATFGPKVPDDS